MRIKLLVDNVLIESRVHTVGDVVEVDDARGNRLCGMRPPHAERTTEDLTDLTPQTLSTGDEDAPDDKTPPDDAPASDTPDATEERSTQGGSERAVKNKGKEKR